jgi:hypothetical protein
MMTKTRHHVSTAEVNIILDHHAFYADLTEVVGVDEAGNVIEQATQSGDVDEDGNGSLEENEDEFLEDSDDDLDWLE